MLKKRLIARIDVKNEFVIKGIHLEGLRKVGNPGQMARAYYGSGIDEIIFMDAVASLYGRNNLLHIIEAACKEVFVPITVGGGIRSLNDIEHALKSGADKVAINTQAIKEPNLISQAARSFGSQCIVASIEAKSLSSSWEAYVDNGRERTGLDAIEWARQLEGLGAGELLVTSVDREGTREGFDYKLCMSISRAVNIPVIASGGAGSPDDLAKLFEIDGIDAAAIAAMIHYGKCSIGQIKSALSEKNIWVRQ